MGVDGTWRSEGRELLGLFGMGRERTLVLTVRTCSGAMFGIADKKQRVPRVKFADAHDGEP